MRAIFLSLILVLPAAAETPLPPPMADTVTLTREQMDRLERELEAIVTKRVREAFEAGRQDARARCASLI